MFRFSGYLSLLTLAFYWAAGKLVPAQTEAETVSALVVVGFVFLITLLSGLILIRKMEDGPENFTRIYLLSLTIRILLYGSFVLVVFNMWPAESGQSAGIFLAVYGVLTAYEIGYLFVRSNRMAEGPKR